MSMGQIAYLALVVAGFSAFAVVLFSAWVWTNWPARFAPARRSMAARTVAAAGRPRPA